MFRLDGKRLVDREEFEGVCAHSFDPTEVLYSALTDAGIPVRDVFQAERATGIGPVFFHGHCQQKTIGAASVAEALMRGAGFEVSTSTVECCGMAGSFGYKKDYYELSVAVGEDLRSQVAAALDGSQTAILVVSGTSCREQLGHLGGGTPMHAVELLRSALVTN